MSSFLISIISKFKGILLKLWFSNSSNALTVLTGSQGRA